MTDPRINGNFAYSMSFTSGRTMGWEVKPDRMCSEIQEVHLNALKSRVTTSNYHPYMLQQSHHLQSTCTHTHTSSKTTKNQHRPLFLWLSRAPKINHSSPLPPLSPNPNPPSPFQSAPTPPDPSHHHSDPLSWPPPPLPGSRPRPHAQSPPSGRDSKTWP